MDHRPIREARKRARTAHFVEFWKAYRCTHEAWHLYPGFNTTLSIICGSAFTAVSRCSKMRLFAWIQ
jgi:hypothetical protein